MKLDTNKFSNHDYDICIIGAGAAGLYITNKLKEKKISLAIVEIGGNDFIKDEYKNFLPIFESDIYLGAIDGRNFGLGGSTQSWGGVLTPYSTYDCKKTDPNYLTWNYIKNVVENNHDEVLKNLKISDKKYFFDEELNIDSHLNNNNYVNIYSKTMHPKHRNFSNFFDNKKVSFYKNSIIKKWIINDSKELLSIDIFSTVSKKFSNIRAKNFIICAGAIESTRILHEINELTDKKIFNKDSDLGYYLGDHISCILAPLDYNKIIIKKFSPTFSENLIRTVRLINKNKNDNLPRFFIHVVFDIKDDAFKIIRNIYKNIQKRKYLKALDVRIFKHLVSIFYYFVTRYLNKKLYIPKNTKINLQIDFEQEPSKDNYIKLSDKLDVYGRKQAIINWKVSRKDKENFNKIINFVSKTFKKDKLFKDVHINKDINNYNFYDAYHPVGTCSIGSNDNNVLDKNLKVKNFSNLYSISTAIFPSAGSANPTFSLLCFANKLSNNLIEKMYEN
jgi:hypothetical protein